MRQLRVACTITTDMIWLLSRARSYNGPDRTEIYGLYIVKYYGGDKAVILPRRPAYIMRAVGGERTTGGVFNPRRPLENRDSWGNAYCYADMHIDDNGATRVTPYVLKHPLVAKHRTSEYLLTLLNDYSRYSVYHIVRLWTNAASNYSGNYFGLGMPIDALDIDLFGVGDFVLEDKGREYFPFIADVRAVGGVVQFLLRVEERTPVNSRLYKYFDKSGAGYGVYVAETQQSEVTKISYCVASFVDVSAEDITVTVNSLSEQAVEIVISYLGLVSEPVTGEKTTKGWRFTCAQDGAASPESFKFVPRIVAVETTVESGSPQMVFTNLAKLQLVASCLRLLKSLDDNATNYVSFTSARHTYTEYNAGKDVQFNGDVFNVADHSEGDNRIRKIARSGLSVSNGVTKNSSYEFVQHVYSNGSGKVYDDPEHPSENYVTILDYSSYDYALAQNHSYTASNTTFSGESSHTWQGGMLFHRTTTNNASYETASENYGGYPDVYAQYALQSYELLQDNVYWDIFGVKRTTSVLRKRGGTSYTGPVVKSVYGFYGYTPGLDYPPEMVIYTNSSEYVNYQEWFPPRLPNEYEYADGNARIECTYRCLNEPLTFPNEGLYLSYQGVYNALTDDVISSPTTAKSVSPWRDPDPANVWGSGYSLESMVYVVAKSGANNVTTRVIAGESEVSGSYSIQWHGILIDPNTPVIRGVYDLDPDGGGLFVVYVPLATGLKVGAYVVDQLSNEAWELGNIANTIGLTDEAALYPALTEAFETFIHWSEAVLQEALLTTTPADEQVPAKNWPVLPDRSEHIAVLRGLIDDMSVWSMSEGDAGTAPSKAFNDLVTFYRKCKVKLYGDISLPDSFLDYVWEGGTFSLYPCP